MFDELVLDSLLFLIEIGYDGNRVQFRAVVHLLHPLEKHIDYRDSPLNHLLTSSKASLGLS